MFPIGSRHKIIMIKIISHDLFNTCNILTHPMAEAASMIT